jgi:glycosyltransferase involved in cell wall biosynthesis
MSKTKKDIVFIMNNLNCGGAEKALVSLLQSLDYSKYNVDLFLFKKEGIFLNKIPYEVNILDEPLEYGFFDMSIKKAIFKNLIKGNFKTIYNRICAGFVLKYEKNSTVAEQKMWRYLSSSMKILPKKYDVAIGYLEKTPNYFCIDKVKAKKKIAFIHTDYKQSKMDSSIDGPYFLKFNTIVTVSDICKEVLIEIFPNIEHKFKTMNNIISSTAITKLASEKVVLDKCGITLMSIGRLNTTKGYDFAIKACKILSDRGLKFKWFILGDGEERKTLETEIKKYHLEKTFVLLGETENPYSFLDKADIFVHTARFEGYGIVITEAKILKKPMLLTDFNTSKTHIHNGINGYIVALEPQEIADGLEKLIIDENLRKQFSNALAQHDYGTENEIESFYSLIKTV